MTDSCYLFLQQGLLVNWHSVVGVVWPCGWCGVAVWLVWCGRVVGEMWPCGWCGVALWLVRCGGLKSKKEEHLQECQKPSQDNTPLSTEGC